MITVAAPGLRCARLRIVVLVQVVKDDMHRHRGAEKRQHGHGNNP